jgi:hypothetical protein
MPASRPSGQASALPPGAGAVPTSPRMGFFGKKIIGVGPCLSGPVRSTADAKKPDTLETCRAQWPLEEPGLDSRPDAALPGSWRPAVPKPRENHANARPRGTAGSAGGRIRSRPCRPSTRWVSATREPRRRMGASSQRKKPQGMPVILTTHGERDVWIRACAQDRHPRCRQGEDQVAAA